MRMTPLQYAQNVEKLCVLPDIYIRLKEIMDDEQSSLTDIASIIMLDPALSSSVLKIVNSALFSYLAEIDEISKAVAVLGINEIHNLINTYGVTTAFSSVDENIIDMDRFWEVSVDTALLCKYLAQKKNIKNTKSIFVSGLLHNIGELIIMQTDPKKVQYCQDYNQDETPWLRQKEVFGFTYADCSTALLTLWELPQSIISPIRNFNNLNKEDTSEAADLLYICTRLALLNSHPGMYSKKTFINKLILQKLDISMEELDEAINFCNIEGIAIMRALKLNN
ncbi:HDOD domain-containing protein [Pseudoalteromonas denitrificans]|uniref:HD-like signal output (HDOD) domain, no enzymatic activity n=1 Tax=Pseudoalteromonas denitrificans DSM 6059 TaxID=1123010 RepID=A0A1I1S358_9GAMM|nr:HDOD domain-containing protein [Pseudoalteromonas denitrificans]SFD41034.1 HD-like signal output (HDOD) domain, no enzymatic activity [Pseudoalteromonas denitrificans DSM 6059]